MSYVYQFTFLVSYLTTNVFTNENLNIMVYILYTYLREQYYLVSDSDILYIKNIKSTNSLRMMKTKWIGYYIKTGKNKERTLK